MRVVLDPAFLLLISVTVGTIGFAVAARRRRVRRALVSVAAINLFCGGLVASLGAAHLVAVVGRALAGKGSGPGGTFVYNFRFYSLMLLGEMLIAGGVTCLTSVPRLIRGDAAGRRVAVSAIVVLLVLSVPLMPIQGFAGAIALLALVNLVALLASIKHFCIPAAGVAARHLSVTPSAVGANMLI